MTRGHSFDRCGQTAKWAAGWRSIGNEANVARSPRRIDARRNKKLFRLHLSQLFELMFPKWFTANDNACFIPAHAARFTTSEQNSSELAATVPPLSFLQ